MTLIIVVSLTILLVSFVCSLLEAVFLSINPAFVAMALKENRRSARIMESLKENIDRPISAILTLNTISHTIGAAVVGALVQKEFGDSYVSWASVILTILILFASEIVPKVLGATYWKQLAPASVYTIQVLIFLLAIFVAPSVWIGRMFSRPETASFTREEMLATAEIGVEEGTIHKKESAIIRNLLMLNNMFVSDIMTPRSVMFALEASENVEEVAQKYRPLRFSRIPVFEGNLDNIIGLTHRYKILEALSSDKHSTPIREITTPINSVPERMTVAGVIDLFVKRKEHLALAVDEYGVITGLVTLEDAIETLLGVEIVDEFDNITDMRQYALEQWQIRKNQIRRQS
jgi:CBS domain containing-hemolysin-like protein